MKKTKFFIFYLTVLLSIPCSIQAASESNFYLLGRASASIEYPLYSPMQEALNRSGFFPSLDEESLEVSNEFALFAKQSLGIFEAFNKERFDELWHSTRRISSSGDYIAKEFGLGWRFKLIIPMSYEWKIMSKDIQNTFHLFFGHGLKFIIPLGSKTKIYAKLGKNFYLNRESCQGSVFDLESNTWQDIKETVWHRTLKDQWRSSLTMLGCGFIRTISSKIELDCSIEGYVTRDKKNYYFSSSLGLNYLI